MTHKAGFVNIIGNPNVGKSTLMNALVGEKLSIITAKAQTTRHRILGIVNEDDYQIVFSDTPGIIKPAYELQSSMMDFVKSALVQRLTKQGRRKPFSRFILLDTHCNPAVVLVLMRPLALVSEPM